MNINEMQRDQVIDVILVVDDTRRFHELNMDMNPRHYSGFTKRLPLSTTDWVQNSGSMIYFNPLIPMKTFQLDSDMRKLKYGVIGLEQAIIDLREWRAFALAGRLHKPVLPFIEDSALIAEAIDFNRDQALNLALLLNYQKLQITTEDIAMTICEFSYKGDIRMRFKMENPNKVKNIVAGSMQGLYELYGPQSSRMKALENQGLVKTGETMQILHTNKNLQYLFDNIPFSVKRGLKESVLQLSLIDLQGDIRKNLEKIVLETSLNMILSGLYSTDPLKNLSYVYSKFRKGRAKK